MQRTNFVRNLIGIIMALLLVSCSKKDSPPPKPATKTPEKALINVVHDAVKLYATGSQAFQAPRGIVITTRKIVRTEQGVQTEFVEINGLEQRGTTVAAIVFHVPATWLTSEKEKLAGLDAEIHDLTACAQKLKEKRDDLKPDPRDSCRVLEVTVDGKPGIIITDEKVKHIQMQMFPLKQ
jgi:hypothetical protein